MGNKRDAVYADDELRRPAAGGILCRYLGQETVAFGRYHQYVLPERMDAVSGRKTVPAAGDHCLHLNHRDVFLPEGFQTAEFLQEHGMIDGIVQRKRIRQMIQFLTLANKRRKGYTNFTNETKTRFLPFLADYIHPFQSF